MDRQEVSSTAPTADASCSNACCVLDHMHTDTAAFACCIALLHIPHTGSRLALLPVCCTTPFQGLPCS